MKTKAAIFLLVTVFSALTYFLLMPKSYYFFSEKFDAWNSQLIRSVLHSGRFLLDPCFKSNCYKSLTSKTPLDVVIPLVEKDLITAEKTVESIRAMVLHPIQNIYIVAPESEKIRSFCHQQGCIFILENEAVENYEELKKQGGWILQQFIKLNADQYTQSDNILVVDGDTVFLRPQVFIDDTKNTYTFHIHSDYTDIRKKFTRDLFKTNQYFKLDFISHHMVFKRKWLKELKEKISEINKCSWQKALLNQATLNKMGFSEYDIYAHYVFSKYRDFTRLRSSANTFIFRDKFQFFELYRSIYSADYKSVSSHHFTNFTSY